MQRDFDLALYHQLQADKELEEQENLEEALKNSRLDQEKEEESEIKQPGFDRETKPSSSYAPSGEKKISWI